MVDDVDRFYVCFFTLAVITSGESDVYVAGYFESTINDLSLKSGLALINFNSNGTRQWVQFADVYSGYENYVGE